MVNVFAVPVYFVVFRETLETSVIVSVLLAFVKQALGRPGQDPIVYKKLVRQIWLGTAAGLVICLCIGGGLVGAFYGLGKDIWSKTEYIWEGAFSLFAAIIISVMGAALLRVSKLQDKWRVKLAKALSKKPETRLNTTGLFKRWVEKYAMFVLPFVTVLREGLEAIVFVAGVSFTNPATAFPIPVITGLATGVLIGYCIYRGGSFATIQVFLIVSTCFLYLVAAGLFSKSVWDFEINAWNNIIGGDASEVGSGPGSYDISKSVWHVNCCNPELNGGGGWGIFNALFGWQNSATLGSVLAYNFYWIAVIACYAVMIFYERKGHCPLLKAKEQVASPDSGDDYVPQPSDFGVMGANGKNDSVVEAERQVAPSARIFGIIALVLRWGRRGGEIIYIDSGHMQKLFRSF